MKRSFEPKLFLFVSVLLLPILCYAQMGNDMEAGKTLSAKAAGIKVSIKVIKVHESLCVYNPASYVWGSEGRCPAFRIYSLNAEREGRQLFVPLSAFSDLTNPSSISIEKITNRKSFQVILVGGDGGSSYRAKLTFDSFALKSRKVENASFPEDAFEQTNYKFNFDVDR